MSQPLRERQSSPLGGLALQRSRWRKQEAAASRQARSHSAAARISRAGRARASSPRWRLPVPATANAPASIPVRRSRKDSQTTGRQTCSISLQVVDQSLDFIELFARSLLRRQRLHDQLLSAAAEGAVQQIQGKLPERAFFALAG